MCPEAVTPGPVGVVSRPHDNTLNPRRAVSFGPIHQVLVEYSLIPSDVSSPICAQSGETWTASTQLVMPDDVFGWTGHCQYTRTVVAFLRSTTHNLAFSAPPLLPMDNLFHPHLQRNIGGQNRKRRTSPQYDHTLRSLSVSSSCISPHHYYLRTYISRYEMALGWGKGEGGVVLRRTPA